jgi:GST-like protein
MIDLYTWETSNGRKASVMLEECGLAYRVFPVDIGKGAQHAPEYLQLNPDNKIPAIVDHDPPAGFGNKPHTVFESGAILLYLAEKTGRLIPEDPVARSLCLQWLMFGLSGFGPMLQQLHYFNRQTAQPVPFAIERYSNEAARLYQVLNKRLADAEYLAGAEYTIADIAAYPWVARYEWQKIDVAAYPNVQRWYAEIGKRPAVQRGFQVPKLAAAT